MQTTLLSLSEVYDSHKMIVLRSAMHSTTVTFSSLEYLIFHWTCQLRWYCTNVNRKFVFVDFKYSRPCISRHEVSAHILTEIIKLLRRATIETLPQIIHTAHTTMGIIHIKLY